VRATTPGRISWKMCWAMAKRSMRHMCASPMPAWVASSSKVASPPIGTFLSSPKRVMPWMPTSSVACRSSCISHCWQNHCKISLSWFN
jgi:hypothetical protein